MTEREITVTQAIREVQQYILQTHPESVIVGLNAASPAGMFETVTGLVSEFGSDRVVESPASEAAVTGIALGMASAGLRPIVIHQRMDFAILAMDQMVNQVAKWHFMYGGKFKAPMIIRMTVGRGWGQGPQHSQALHAWLAHVPGLRVMFSSFPKESMNSFYWSFLDDAPVIFIEHRWMHLVKGLVEESAPKPELVPSIVRRRGSKVTLVGVSFMTVECLSAAQLLESREIDAEVIEVLSLTPLNVTQVVRSVQETGRLLVCDIGVREFGISAEIVAEVLSLVNSNAPVMTRRLGLPSVPTPSAPEASAVFYPTAVSIANVVLDMFAVSEKLWFSETRLPHELDVPNSRFLGPY